jgi:sulfur-carrier protein adenylyltransferase/sulfurtransferase
VTVPARVNPAHSTSTSPLTDGESLRYSRQIILPEIGEAGQLRLKSSSVLVAGAGGLGSPVAMYLAAAGVGRIGIIDSDDVEPSNLHRQLLHGTADIGRKKTESAADSLRAMNPHVLVETHHARLTRDNALDILRGYDVVADGTDNFPSRHLVNDACVMLGIPNVSGSIHRFEGQLSVYAHAAGPCCRCLFREPPPAGLVPSCAESGVLGVLPGIVGTMQAAECIKLILGIGEPLVGRLLIVDALRMRFRTMSLERDPECVACGTHSLRELPDYEAFCGMAPDDAVPAVAPRELAALRAGGSAPSLIDVREPDEWEADRLSGAEHIPLGRLEKEVHRVTALEREIVVYCRSGARGAEAGRRLRAFGVRRVRNLEGGLLRYRAEVYE